jgi:hypothetical protein
LPKSFCAVLGAKSANVAPPVELTPANFAIPVIRNGRAGLFASTPIESPTR